MASALAPSLNVIRPSNLQNSPTTTIAAAVIGAQNNITPARGLFIVAITDVAAASTFRVTIIGGTNRGFGNPGNAYVALSGSSLNENVVITNVGTHGASLGETTIVVQDATTGSEFTFVYNAYTDGSSLFPTIQNTAGAVPAGNTLVVTTYLNYGGTVSSGLF